MPKAIKKRIPKKKPVEENEVKGALMQILDTVKERQKEVTIGAAAVLVVIVIIAAAKFFSSSSYEEAYSIEMQANDYYYGAADKSVTGEERWKKAMELYQKSIDVKVTPTALFYLGNCNYNLGEYEAAIKKYTEFENKFRRETGILPLVYQKLASAYFKTGQNDRAIQTLGSLAGLEGGIYKDTAMILEARYYGSAGDKQKALEIYRNLNTEFPSSIWSMEAAAKVSAEEAPKDESVSEETEAASIPPSPEVREESIEKQTEGPLSGSK